LLTLSGINKTYGSLHVLKDLTLTIPENSVYGIIGQSGAGKSTLIRIIGLLEKPDSGSIVFGDDALHTLEGQPLLQRRRRIGTIFQNFNLFSSRNAGANIAYPLELAGTPKPAIRKRVAELLDLVGLADKILSPVSKLSGGQKQRVAIARALATQPDLLLCDEATSALDPHTTESILTLIQDIQKRLGLTVVMITHHMEVVRRICDRVAVLEAGRIVEEGRVHDVFAHPQHPTTKEFISNLAPEEFQAVPDGPRVAGIYRLLFDGPIAEQPVLSRLIRDFDIDVNILGGSIKRVGNTHVGELTVEFRATEASLKEAVAWLAQQGIPAEEAVNV